MKGKKAKRWFGFCVLVLLALVALDSCRTPAGRTPGEVVDDSTITTKVKGKLFEDGMLKGMAISVDTFEGNVTLTGAVANEQQKARATAVARSVYGVKKVNNLLSIRKP